MSATLRLDRTMPGMVVDVEDRKRTWNIRLDGRPAGTIARNDVLELPIEPGHHTLQLTSTGKRTSPVHGFDAAEESMVEFTCHSQPVWPLMLMALVVPGRWIVLKQH
jgi:hypothetical protein